MVLRALVVSCIGLGAVLAIFYTRDRHEAVTLVNPAAAVATSAPSSPRPASAPIPALVPDAVAASAASPGKSPRIPKLAIPSTFLGRKIGSEGYGPHIVATSVSGSVPDSLAAYRQIKYCDELPERERLIQENRAVANPSANVYQTPEYLYQQAALTAMERARCQTVDASTRALMLPLTRRAADAGVPGGVEAYADAVLSMGDDKRWPEALQLLRAAAARMDEAAFAMLAWGDRTVPLGDVERAAYQLAMMRLEGEGWQIFGAASSRVGVGGPKYEIKLTPEQSVIATQRADAIYAECCTGWKQRKTSP